MSEIYNTTKHNRQYLSQYECFMFGYVMSDPERCKFFLEQILDIQIDHVEYLEKQKTIDMKIDARSVRLDIYMSDGKAIYNVEIQTTSGKNLPKRSLNRRNNA